MIFPQWISVRKNAQWHSQWISWDFWVTSTIINLFRCSADAAPGPLVTTS
jgi:hypothetical protein